MTGYRSVPLTPELIHDYASDIAGEPLGQNWTPRFLLRHRDIKVQKAATLEANRAQALNTSKIDEFYDVLKDLTTKYHIPPENMYNADEKGALMGIGKPVAALFDRSQQTLKHVVDGNRELVTIIETVCADGTALLPSVIFKEKRLDAEWSRDNPGNARYVLCFARML